MMNLKSNVALVSILTAVKIVSIGPARYSRNISVWPCRGQKSRAMRAWVGRYAGRQVGGPSIISCGLNEIIGLAHLAFNRQFID